MTPATTQDVVKYWIERAYESIDAVKFIVPLGNVEGCLSLGYRPYFEAVTALFAQAGLESRDHDTLRRLFYRHFIKTGLIAVELGILFREIQEARREVDYDLYTEFSVDDALHWIDESEPFVKKIAELIEELQRNAIGDE